VTFFEGLRESQHPYKVLVEVGLLDMLHAPNAGMKIVPLLSNIAPPLRNALSQANKVAYFDKELFLITLRIFKELIRLVGPEIEPFLGALLPPIASRVLNHDHTIRDEVLRSKKGARCIDRITASRRPKMFGSNTKTYPHL
jgi:hypothetical protein